MLGKVIKLGLGLLMCFLGTASEIAQAGQCIDCKVIKVEVGAGGRIMIKFDGAWTSTSTCSSNTYTTSQQKVVLYTEGTDAAPAADFIYSGALTALTTVRTVDIYGICSNVLSGYEAVSEIHLK